MPNANHDFQVYAGSFDHPPRSIKGKEQVIFDASNIAGILFLASIGATAEIL
jgi:hypothetical protein